jgi:type II secretory pathway pseudopilin PulG
MMVIGILAAVAIPGYQRFIERAKVSSVRGNVHVIQTGVEAFNVVNLGTYPVAADAAAVRAMLPGAEYPENPFTLAPTVVAWDADPVDSGEITISTLPGGGYRIRAMGLTNMITPDVQVGD